MGESTTTSVNWGMICHLAGLTTYIGIPFGNILAPLVIWIAKRDTDPFVREQGKEAVNFNISYTIYGLLALLLCWFLIGIILLPIFFVAHIILVIWATVKANKGESVRYPYTLRFID